MARALTAVIALAFTGLFVYFWTDVLIAVERFEPSDTNPKLELAASQVTVLSVLSTAVATGTAAVLGITIVQQNGNGAPQPLTQPTFAARVQAVASALLKSGVVLWFGILSYLIIGLLVIRVWYFHSDVAPEAVATFGASVLGWGAGAIAAVFKAAP